MAGHTDATGFRLFSGSPPEFEDIIDLAIGAGYLYGIGVTPPGERAPELKHQGYGIQSIEGQATHTRRGHVVKDPFVADFMSLAISMRR